METQTNVVEEIERRRQVNVPAIERELTELWKAAAESKQGNDAAVTRVCLLNLLIYTSDPEGAAEISDVIAKVTEEAPCRAIVMLGDRASEEDTTQAWISSHCHLDDKMRQVCCEEIRVSASGEGLLNLERTVAPLIVPDLPVFLWWQDAKSLDEKYFQDFLYEVNRVIVDSRTLTHLDHEFADLARFTHDARRKCAFSDLAWTRLTNWRDLVSGLFDSRDNRAYLDSVSNITIRYAHDGATPGVPARALLLASWLGAQLGWKLKDAQHIDDTRCEFRFRSNRARVHVEIVPEEHTGMQLHDITHVGLSVGKPETAKFAISKKASEVEGESLFETTVAIEGGANYQRAVSLPQPNDAYLICREVSIFGRNKTYEKAIYYALELISELEADSKLQ